MAFPQLRRFFCCCPTLGARDGGCKALGRRFARLDQRGGARPPSCRSGNVVAFALLVGLIRACRSIEFPFAGPFSGPRTWEISMSHRLSPPLSTAFVLTLLIGALAGARPALAECERDADGSCSRPVACKPPEDGKCTTIPRLPGASQFGCECRGAKARTISSGGSAIGGHRSTHSAILSSPLTGGGGSSPAAGGPNPANAVGQCFEGPNCKAGPVATLQCRQCGDAMHGGSWLRTTPAPARCFNLSSPGDCPK
jgi:hypothetical protein